MTSVMRGNHCKRCGGNVFPAHYEHGDYFSCIQCGAVYYGDQQSQERLKSYPEALAGANRMSRPRMTHRPGLLRLR